MNASTFESSIVLRPYQIDTINAVLKKWREYDRLLVIEPTGAGKTIEFANIAEARIPAGPC